MSLLEADVDLDLVDGVYIPSPSSLRGAKYGPSTLRVLVNDRLRSMGVREVSPNRLWRWRNALYLLGVPGYTDSHVLVISEYGRCVSRTHEGGCNLTKAQALSYLAEKYGDLL